MERTGRRELAGWLTAVAIALIVAGQVASTARAELLFRDGDSLVVALFVRSVLDGAPLDWAMSSVLFAPQSALSAVLSLLPLGVNGLFALNAVVNVLGLYGAVRLTAGRRRPGRAPVAWSLVAVATFAVIAITETSASRDGLELASLLLTTTYYSATVIAMIASVGIARRVLDRQHPGRALPIALGVVAAVSTFTNPLYVAWAVVPLALLLLWIARRSAQRRSGILLLGILAGAGALGMLARIPLGPWIMRTGATYVQPALWTDSVRYYGGLALERLSTPGGVIAALILVGLVAAAVIRTVRGTDASARLVTAFAWLAPVLVVVGAVVLGTHASRYLQPALYAPLLVLVAAPRAVVLPRSRVFVAAGAAVLLVASVVSVPRLQAAAARPDADLSCVTSWIEASDRTGGGQFWDVRLPKLHLDDPGRLVQLHANLDGYAWLVNREDFAVGEVTFLLEGGQMVPWALPAGAEPDAVIPCGRYRILDFGSHPLPIGPART